MDWSMVGHPQAIHRVDVLDLPERAEFDFGIDPLDDLAQLFIASRRDANQVGSLHIRLCFLLREGGRGLVSCQYN